MAIVASSVESVAPQHDGRRWVRELHTDQVGKTYERNYLAAAADDVAAALAVYAGLLSQALQDAEIAANVAAVISFGSLATPTFVYSGASANVAALRAAYQGATQLQAVMIGDFLNTLTDAQLQAAFGLTAGQVTTLRANKLQPAATAAATIRATTGQ